jgi:LysR family transcriptional regulator, glycine cleavage system transcriptional activator
MLPPLNALRAFEAAARHGRIVDAAAELCVTHGAVSRQVKQLEQSLGVKLFRRAGTGVELTDAGVRLLPALSSAFDLIETGVERVTPSPGSALLVSCSGTFIIRWLIPRLHGFRSRHPDIEIRLSESDAPVDFAQDAADLAIRTMAPPWPDDMVTTPIFGEEVGPVLSPELQAELKIRSVDDLARAPLIHTETRATAWSDWFAAVGRSDIDPRTGDRFEHFYYLLQAAASGLGVAIGPRPLVDDDIVIGRLVAPLGYVETGLHYVVLRPLRDDVRVDTFVEWLADAAVQA